VTCSKSIEEKCGGDRVETAEGRIGKSRVALASYTDDRISELKIMLGLLAALATLSSGTYGGTHSKEQQKELGGYPVEMTTAIIYGEEEGGEVGE
jgi:hypothetical protein